MFFETLLYYVFFSSSLFLYGVGINRMADIGFIKRIDITFYVKLILAISITAVVGWLVTNYILLPLGIITYLFVSLKLIIINKNKYVKKRNSK